MSRRLFTSESVTEGHPDKICDQISDTILDALVKDDPRSRVAVETMVTTGLVHVAGEVTTAAYADIPGLVRETILDIGYDSSTKGFDGHSCGVSVSIGAQSPDIAQGVDDAWEHRSGAAVDPLDLQGAGDQGLMFGYACDETPELMPLPITLAHRLAEQLSRVRRNHVVPYLRPDGKTQVTIEYEGDRPVRLDTVVVSTQHAGSIDLETLLTPDITAHVVEPVLRERHDLPAGSLFVPVDQPLARLAVALLEPQAPDSMAAWGMFNNHFERKEYMEAYVAEEVAREMLAADPGLRAQFERRLREDQEFAADPRARLDFFYRRHSAWDTRLDLYPIMRTDRVPR